MITTRGTLFCSVTELSDNCSANRYLVEGWLLFRVLAARSYLVNECCVDVCVYDIKQASMVNTHIIRCNLSIECCTTLDYMLNTANSVH